MNEIEELTIEVTHECPLDCKFCSSKNSEYDTKESELTKKQIKKFIDKFNPNSIRWSGGEPLLYLDEDHIKIALGRNQVISTNGFYPERLMKIHKEFDEIRVTLLGKQERHDKITQKKGSWEKATQSIENLIEKGRKPVITSPFISKEQIKQVKNIAKDKNLKTKIIGLVPTKDVKRPEKEEKKNNYKHCSLGGAECRREKKRLVMPNSKVVECAVEKRNYECPYKK